MKIIGKRTYSVCVCVYVRKNVDFFCTVKQVTLKIITVVYFEKKIVFALRAFLQSVATFFELNAHNMLNTYIYHNLPATYFGVCNAIFRETIALLAEKLYAFCSVVQHAGGNW